VVNTGIMAFYPWYLIYLPTMETSSQVPRIRKIEYEKTPNYGKNWRFYSDCKVNIYNTMKKNVKKVNKLYLSVFFFFALFSFSGKVYADTNFSSYGHMSGDVFTWDVDPVIIPSGNAYTEFGLSNGGNEESVCTGLSNVYGGIGTGFGLGNPPSNGANTYYFTMWSGDGGAFCNGTQYGHIVFTYSGGIWTLSGVDPNSSEIQTVTPYNGQIVATSTNHTIGATGFLHEDDVNDYSAVRIHLENSNQSFLQCADVICAGFSENSISRDFYYQLFSETNFSYSSSTQGLPVGKYYVTTEITKGSFCLFGYCAFNTTVVSTSTTFVVATTTKLDKLKDNASQYIDTLSGGDPTFDDCTVTSFNFFTCMSDLVIYLFIPESDAIEYMGNQIYDDILTHFPLGYVTDFVSILSTSTVGSLTVLDATVPSGVMGSGSHIRLDLTGILDEYLNATTSGFNNSSASSTETLFEITNYYWEMIVYILTIMYLARRVLGSGIIPKKMI